MKTKTLCAIALTAAALAVAPSAVAAPPNDRVTGAGTILLNFGTESVHVSVSASKPADGDPSEGTGNIVVKFPGEPAMHGTVECLAISGSTARVIAQFDDSEPLYARLDITDRGNGSTEPDAANLRINDSGFSCVVGGPLNNTIQDGNFTVEDN